MIQVFRQTLEALEGQAAPFSSRFIEWLRAFVKQANDTSVLAAILDDLTALSVLGRSSNTDGPAAAITAANDGEVLRRSGTSIGFGQLATAALADAIVTYAKIQNVGALSVFGRSTNSGGVGADIAAGTDGHVLRRSGTTLGFGQLAIGAFADAVLTFAKLQNFDALSVLGRSANSAGVGDEIAAGTDGHILRRSGNTLGFGKILANFITGTSTNDNAAAGDIGEYVESLIASGAVGSWSTGTAKNVTSISLTAGDWDVSGAVFFSNTSATAVTRISSGITTSSATLPAAENGRGQLTSVVLNPVGAAVPSGTVRISLAATTTVYLVGQIDFAAGTPSAGGYINARRVR